MFRRLRLPGKLVLAAVPLILALSGVSALFVQTAFDQADEERHATELAVVMGQLRSALDALALEADSADQAATDAAFAQLRAAIEDAGAQPLARQLDSATRRLEAARSDAGVAGFNQVAADLLAVGALVPAEVANEESARSLEGLHAIGRARQVARQQETVIFEGFPLEEADRTTLERVQALQVDFTGWVDLFHTVASAEARTIFAQSGAPVAIGGVSTQINRLLSDGGDSGTVISVEDWELLLEERSAALGVFEERLTEAVRTAADTAANRATIEAWFVVAAATTALVLAAVLTALISRSIVRRVRSITERAQHVAQEQLPALVEALRDPGEDAALPTIPPIRDRGADEVGDLARSFAAMQSTLEHVAAQQVEILRKGVAEMFITLARRNRSLIDRQLALIDELEADEEDPAALADFYRLDHMATRMRRNAESLLVLAGTEPPRKWRQALGIDDVVRAAIGEIEDYRRVDVLTLEQVRLKGSVVADLSHLLSELLENAAQFSPPQTRVRISGHFHEQGYLLTVADRGVGMTQARLGELNHLLERPPVVGLALEPTLGLYVVAMLAKRHGIGVRLVPGAPGVSAKLLIPAAVYEVPTDPVDMPIEPLVNEVPFAPARMRPTPASTPAADAVPPVPVNGAASATRSASHPEAGAVSEPTSSVSEREHHRHLARPEVNSAAPTAKTTELGSLPVRQPGTSYAPETEGERPVSQYATPADSVRSSLGAFQMGLEAARRSVAEVEGDEE